MTFKPTKRNQKLWVQAHLNGGVCPKTRKDYYDLRTDLILEGRPYKCLACWEALDWLSESDIKTLEEAWDQCDRPDWLIWTVLHMKPDKKDVTKVRKLMHWLIGCDWLASVGARGAIAFAYTNIEGYYLTESPKAILTRAAICLTALCEPESLRKLSKVEGYKLLIKVKKLWPNPWRMK
jgi:hypothetical protein